MELTLRKVVRKDWDYILKLRNNPNFRLYFYEQHNISKKEHYAYLNKQKRNANFFNWIICYNNKDIGYVRILDNDISVMLEEKFQSKGFGTEALQLVEKQSRKLGLKKLIGRVMVENKASQKIFLKNGFKLKLYWYEKELD